MKQMKRGSKRRTRRLPPRRGSVVEERQGIEQAADASAGRPANGPVLTGGDVDADWKGANSTGEEAVGGSVATPDQDVVDEIGRALGVEQESDAEVTMSEEILRRRDRLRWHLEREAEAREREEEHRSETEERGEEGDR